MLRSVDFDLSQALCIFLDDDVDEELRMQVWWGGSLMRGTQDDWIFQLRATGMLYRDTHQ